VAKSNLAAAEALRLWLAHRSLPRPGDEAEAEALVAAALEQGLAGLLRAAVGERDDWPASARRRLADAHRALLARGVVQLQLQARAARLLEAAGVPALPLKGAAVAETLYASVADRPMADVDLLALGDFSAAVAALGAAGFRKLAEADHAWVFHDPESGERLELHHGLSSCPGLFPVDAHGLWTRRRPGPGPVAWVPCAEDLLVQLSLHAAFQHGLVLSLVQHLDLRRLLEGPLDPALAARAAGQARAAPAVAAALELSRRVLGATVDPALEAAFAGERPRGLLRWLDTQEPASFVTPAPAAVVRARFAIARGRRARLLALTLSPASPLGSESILHRLGRALARTPGLIERWGPFLAPATRSARRSRLGV
jgi:hypothetical protein